MRKVYLYVLFACISFNIFAMKLNGDPASWSEENFIGFDQVGDCLSSIGDISSVFTAIEDNSLLLRVTFDGMLDRQFGLDKFYGENIWLNLDISDSGGLVFSDTYSIAT